MSAALGWLGKYPRDVVGAVHPRVVDAFMQGMHRGCFVAAGVAVLLGLVAYATLPATVEHNTTGLALH